MNDDAPNPYSVPEVDEILDDVIGVLEAARPMPMSSTVKVNRDELLDLLIEARHRLPEELRNARWLLKQREEFLERAEHEKAEIIESGRSHAARMVERQEIVKASEVRARQILSDAQTDARNLLNQTEDFCDQRLAQFEAVLDKVARTVADGRAKLAATAGPTAFTEDGDDAVADDFFDADELAAG